MLAFLLSMAVFVLVKVFNLILEVLFKDYTKKKMINIHRCKVCIYTYNQQVYDGMDAYHVTPIVDGSPNNAQ